MKHDVKYFDLAAKQMRFERTLASAWLDKPIRPFLTRILATFDKNILKKNLKKKVFSP